MDLRGPVVRSKGPSGHAFKRTLTLASQGVFSNLLEPYLGAGLCR
jgi:hypothetical protein